MRVRWLVQPIREAIGSTLRPWSKTKRRYHSRGTHVVVATMKSQQVVVTSSVAKLKKVDKRECLVIVTCRTLLWLLLTVVACFVIVAAFMSPQWMVGPSEPVTLKDRDTTTDSAYFLTIGIYNRCTKMHTYDAYYSELCAPFVEGLNMLDQTWSNFWKTSVIFFGIGLLLMTITVLTGLLGLCVQAMCKKSLFVICGLLQAIAGKYPSI